VHNHGGFLHVATQKVWQSFERAGDAVINQLSLLWRGFFQHPVQNFGFDTWVANANA
jgi:hypothetical protein